MRVSTLYIVSCYENPILAAALVWDKIIGDIRGNGDMDLTKMVYHYSQNTNTNTNANTKMNTNTNTNTNTMEICT